MDGHYEDDDGNDAMDDYDDCDNNDIDGNGAMDGNDDENNGDNCKGRQR